MLHNFGGRSGLYGRMPVIATVPAQALAANSTSSSLFGLGLTPEAIESNPIVYDLMMENVWRGTTGVPDLPAWVQAYVGRRYAGHVPSSVYTAWQILMTTVYDCPTLQQGTSASIFAAAPSFNVSSVSCCSDVSIYYEPQLLQEALALFLQGASESGSLGDQSTFQHDLVMLTAQVMSNYAVEVQTNAMIAYQYSDVQTFNASSNEFLSLIQDLDQLMGTQELFLFGAWIANATRWGNGTVLFNDTCASSVNHFDCGYPDVPVDYCESLGCCYNITFLNTPGCFFTNLTDTQVLERNARRQVWLELIHVVISVLVVSAVMMKYS
jgi:alpha-N-acetylglucosaminidase